jgi:predicted deacylase
MHRLLILAVAGSLICLLPACSTVGIPADSDRSPTSAVSHGVTPSARPSATPAAPALPQAQVQTASPSATAEPPSTPANSPAIPFAIGTSEAGRPLQVYAFGSGEHARMIVAGIHGGYEGNTSRLADELIQVLAARPDLVPPSRTLYILRSLNPDGEARSSSYKGRVNENLVDLNRNWPALWESSWPLEGCWTFTYVTAGAYPASEAETRALMNFLVTYRVEALISYHSAALGIFPGGQPPDPDSISLAEALSAVSDYPYPPIDTGCKYTGQLIDWASDMGIAAVDIELTNHMDTDLYQNLRVLEAFLSWEP